MRCSAFVRDMGSQGPTVEIVRSCPKFVQFNLCNFLILHRFFIIFSHAFHLVSVGVCALLAVRPQPADRFHRSQHPHLRIRHRPRRASVHQTLQWTRNRLHDGRSPHARPRLPPLSRFARQWETPLEGIAPELDCVDCRGYLGGYMV